MGDNGVTGVRAGLAATLAVAMLGGCSLDLAALMGGPGSRPAAADAQGAGNPARLAIDMADESGESMTLRRESVRSVHLGDRKLGDGEFDVEKGELRFHGPMGPAPRPIRIELADGRVLEGAHVGPGKPPRAVFVPGSDGRMHLGDPARSLPDNVASQRERDRQHRVHVPLTVPGLDRGKAIALAILPSGAPGPAPVPGFAYEAAPGEIAFDVQVLNLLTFRPVEPGGQPKPQGPSTPDAIKGATFVLVINAGAPRVTVARFGLLRGDLAQQDPQTMRLPPAQHLAAGDVSAPEIKTYETLDEAFRAERLPKPGPGQPAPPHGPAPH
ncbi:MAG: hypothetical protein FJZ01_22385 [Candidatus Sericytochromatia bacterium]|nr:hypothetical protein [Candidatus Tanganyikabacteria bacterium]